MAKNSKFDKRLATLGPEILTKIAGIDELKGRWSGQANLNPNLLGRLKRSVLITSTGASTRIEGAKLSDEDVERFIKGIAIQKFEDRDKQEVQGYYELLQNVFDAWETIPFSEGTIKHFHKELLKYVAKDQLHKGEYKKQENQVEMVDENGRRIGILFKTTPAYLTPVQMLELLEWTQSELQAKKYHPLLVVGNFLVEYLSIHPFTDGNGRLSRILTNLLLLKQGYPYMPYVSHEKLIEDKKPQYYIALRQSQKTFGGKNEDINPWLNFFLDIIQVQSKQASELMSSENIEMILSTKQLNVWQYLHSVAEATPQEIVNATKIARPTVYQTLSKLLKLKRIERLGLGRSTRYRKLS